MKRNNCAFTLLETILGLAIFAVIGVSVYNTFAAAIRLNRQADSIMQLYRDGAGTIHQMAADLESAVPYDLSTSYPEKKMFAGDANSMEFIVPTGKGLRTVKYGLNKPDASKVHTVRIGRRFKKNVSQVVNETQSGEFYDLSYGERPLAESLNGAAESSESEALIASVREKDIQFSYAYQEGKGENVKIVWKDSWKDNFIPAGVKIVLTLPNPQKATAQPVTFERLVFIPTGSWGKSENEK